MNNHQQVYLISSEQKYEDFEGISRTPIGYYYYFEIIEDFPKILFFGREFADNATCIIIEKHYRKT